MLGSFLLPLRHLPFDHPRIDPVASWVGTLTLHLPEQPPVPRLERFGRLAVAFGEAAFQDLETPRKRQPVRVETDRRGGLEHQRPNDEMTQRQRIEFLDHTRGRLAPKLRRLGRTPWVVVRLLFVEDPLFPPPL